MANLRDEFRELLLGRHYATLATHADDGTIHTTPVWYMFEGGQILRWIVVNIAKGTKPGCSTSSHDNGRYSTTRQRALGVCFGKRRYHKRRRVASDNRENIATISYKRSAGGQSDWTRLCSRGRHNHLYHAKGLAIVEFERCRPAIFRRQADQ
jgi:hypothetical protein